MHAERAGEGGREEGRRQLKKRTYFKKNGEEKEAVPVAAGAPDRSEVEGGMNSWRAWTTATALLISVRPRTTKYGIWGREEGTLRGRTKMSVCGAEGSLSGSEVWSIGRWKKSSLPFHDGFSVGIRNPPMKGKREREGE